MGARTFGPLALTVVSPSLACPLDLFVRALVRCFEVAGNKMGGSDDVVPPLSLGLEELCTGLRQGTGSHSDFLSDTSLGPQSLPITPLASGFQAEVDVSLKGEWYVPVTS